mgnify:CR=1 FL=1
MPTSTARYRFEFRMFDWVQGLSRSLCGTRTSLFIGIRKDGSMRRIYFARPTKGFDGDQKSTLAESHPAWLLYQPYEELGSGYLEWFGLDRKIAERWLSDNLTEADFLDVRSKDSRDDWPSAWRVIVG